MSQTSTITSALKAQCIQEAIDCKNATAVARHHGLRPRRVQQWVQEAARQTAPRDVREITKMLREQATENARLKSLLGEKDLEIAILKDLVKKINPGPSERCVVAHRWVQRGYRPTLVCRLAGVARAIYYSWRARQQRPPAAPGPSRGGRPRRGYVWTTTGTKVSEAQIVDWLAEYIADPVGQAVKANLC